MYHGESNRSLWEASEVKTYVRPCSKYILLRVHILSALHSNPDPTFCQITQTAVTSNVLSLILSLIPSLMLFLIVSWVVSLIIYIYAPKAWKGVCRYLSQKTYLRRESQYMLSMFHRANPDRYETNENTTRLLYLWLTGSWVCWIILTIIPVARNP